MGSLRDGWRQVWREPGAGLWSAEQNDGERFGVDLRAGIMFPAVRLVGVRHVAAGALVIAGYEPATERVRVLSSVQFGSMLPLRDRSGWPVDLGAMGAICEATGFWGVDRFLSAMGDDELFEWIRLARRHVRSEMDRARFRGYHLIGDEADKVIWRYASERRLRMSPKLTAGMERERATFEGTGPQPLREALAAVLVSWDLRPWRAPVDSEPWVPIRSH